MQERMMTAVLYTFFKDKNNNLFVKASKIIILPGALRRILSLVIKNFESRLK
jgi:hypothetical protein